MSFNFRTHQKYLLIDEKIGYCGGINLADEYFDRKERFGYWKDSATRIEGEAVRSMEAMFLVMWQVCTKERKKLSPLPPREASQAEAFVRPFDGGPAKNPDNPVQALYDMVIARAAEHLYITTPYLVLDRQMTANLIRAAQSGVDVRIMMPGIYDKGYVHAVSRHNFGPLLRQVSAFLNIHRVFCMQRSWLQMATLPFADRLIWISAACGNIMSAACCLPAVKL